MDKARVIKIEPGFAHLLMEVSASCRGCANQKVCCSGGGSPQPVRIRNDYGLLAGDEVELEFSASAKLALAFLLFMVPVLSVIAGYAIGYFAFKSETFGIIGAGIGLLDAMVFLVIWGRIVKKRDNLRPEYLKIIKRNAIDAQ